MDNVCKTCIRIIDVNEPAICINNPEIREKLLSCVPDICLDNVEDPKICNTCHATLSLTCRFKGMCYQSDKTINSCREDTISIATGSAKPLNRIELLTIGRRDIGDVLVADASNFSIAEEIEVESFVDNYAKVIVNDANQYLESLQILSDVASQATKAVSNCNELPSIIDDITLFEKNWDDEIKGTRIERPKVTKKIINDHIQGTIENVIAGLHTDSRKRKLSDAETPKVPAKISTRLNSSSVKNTEEYSKKVPVKVVVETAPAIDIIDKMGVALASPVNKKSVKNKYRTKYLPRGINAKKKLKRGLPRNKFVHQTGEDESLDELRTVTTILEPHTKTDTLLNDSKEERFKKSTVKPIPKKGSPTTKPIQMQHSITPQEVVQSKQAETSSTKVVRQINAKAIESPVTLQVTQIEEQLASPAKIIKTKGLPVTPAMLVQMVEVRTNPAEVVQMKQLPKSPNIIQVGDAHTSLTRVIPKKELSVTPPKVVQMEESPSSPTKVIHSPTKVIHKTDLVVSPQTSMLQKNKLPVTEHSVVYKTTPKSTKPATKVTFSNVKTKGALKIPVAVSTPKSDLEKTIIRKSSMVQNKDDSVNNKFIKTKSNQSPTLLSKNATQKLPPQKILRPDKSVTSKLEIANKKIIATPKKSEAKIENVHAKAARAEIHRIETFDNKTVLGSRKINTNNSYKSLSNSVEEVDRKIATSVAHIRGGSTDVQLQKGISSKAVENDIEEPTKKLKKHSKKKRESQTETKENLIKEKSKTKLTNLEPQTILDKNIDNQLKSNRQKILFKTPQRNTKTKDGDFKKAWLTPKTKKPNCNEAQSTSKLLSEKTGVAAPAKKSPKLANDILQAIDKLLETAEFKKLLQLETKSEQTLAKKAIITQKLQQLEKFYKAHKKIKEDREAKMKTKSRLVVTRKLQASGSKTRTPKRKHTAKSSRITKALEDINLDLAEINDGVERQKQELAATQNLSVHTTPESVKLSPTVPIKKEAKTSLAIQKSQNTSVVNMSKSTKSAKQQVNNTTIEDESESQGIRKSPGKKHVSYAVRAIRRRQQIREAKSRGKVYYKRKEIDGRSLKKRQPIQTCDQCGKIFKYISHLNVHKRAHVLFKNFICELCGKGFTVQKYLLCHTMLHFTAGDNQCLTCGKYFSSAHVLKKHQLTHSGIKPFVCEMCGRRFSQRINLEVHTRIHTREKDFICYICNFAFGQKVHLVAHIRTHTGEKPYACDLCPKAYAKNAVLRDHKTLHMLKPYMCNNCNTLFRDEKCLERHLKRYSNKSLDGSTKCPCKVFNCGICSRRFTSRFSRNRHMKVHVKDLIEGIGTKF